VVRGGVRRIELDRVLQRLLGAGSVVLVEQLDALVHPVDRLHAVAAGQVAARQDHDEGDDECGEKEDDASGTFPERAG
jgi:hypothetical protein